MAGTETQGKNFQVFYSFFQFNFSAPKREIDEYKGAARPDDRECEVII